MRARIAFLVAAALLAALTLTPSIQAQPLVNIETVTVGDAGNAADTTGYGAVAYEFSIAKYEVTLSQYSTFLNSVAAVAPPSYLLDLWTVTMSSSLGKPGIDRTGSGSVASPFVYTVSGSGDHPVFFVSWFDAARFANWMNNGAVDGASTEAGAYALNGATTGINLFRDPNASWWIPSEDEWYKAAYYKGGGIDSDYWLYPTQSDAAPTAQNPPGGQNSANYNRVRPSPDRFTDVGAYHTSPSAYDTFDQGGNVWEWTDGIVGSTERALRGGAWDADAAVLQSTTRGSTIPSDEGNVSGFRLATVPEPSTYALLLMTGAGALWWAGRRR